MVRSGTRAGARSPVATEARGQGGCGGGGCCGPERRLRAFLDLLLKLLGLEDVSVSAVVPAAASEPDADTGVMPSRTAGGRSAFLTYFHPVVALAKKYTGS